MFLSKESATNRCTEICLNFDTTKQVLLGNIRPAFLKHQFGLYEMSNIHFNSFPSYSYLNFFFWFLYSVNKLQPASLNTFFTLFGVY